MFYLYHGEDDFTSREMAVTIRARYVDQELGDLGLRVMDGEACTWDELSMACRVLPFLSRYQVVEVRGLLGAAAAGGKGTKRIPGAAQFVAFVADLPPTTVLILVEGALSEANPYIKGLQDAPLADAVIQRNALMAPAAVGRWLQERAKAAGISIDGAAIDLLRQIHKADLWSLRSDIAKLASYAGPGGTISRAVVEELVPAAAEATVFALADAIAQRKLHTALSLLHTLLEGGAAPEYIMAVLAGRLRDWLAGTGRGPRPAGLSHAALVDAFDALLNTDRVLKNGSSDDRLLVMDLLITVLVERLPSSLLEGAFAAA